MTEISFHFNLPDRTQYVCRLLRKAVRQGVRVAVVGAQADLQSLDSALWAFSATDFVPHCVFGVEAGVLSASAVVLGVPPEQSSHHDVLLNLGAEVPAGFERFERLIEVVGEAEEERAFSRRRWKYYRERGYSMVRHDQARKESH